MFLNRKKNKDPQESARERIIDYKKFFSSQEGREIMFDLMNRFHILNSHGGDQFKEGQRSVVLHILAQANVDLVHYDKILKGELNV